MKRPRFAAVIVAAALAGIAGCGSVGRELRPWESVTPSSRFDPALSTSPQCLAAAKRATYYCDQVNKETDYNVQNAAVYACNDGERDFYRYCR